MKIPTLITLPNGKRSLFAAALLLSATAASAQTLQVAKNWEIAVNAGRTYVSANGALERGIAYNPATGHTLLVHRPNSQVEGDTLQVVILDSTTGEEIGFMDVSGISGGTFALSQIKVADDGAIYGANLSTLSQDFRLYRWENEDAFPVLVYSGRPGGIDDTTGISRNARFGDNLDVRGSGLNTQVLVGSGPEQNIAALIVPDESMEDPMTMFKAIPILINGISAGDIQKGVSFGDGNVFYGKRTGTPNVRVIQFTLPTGEETAGTGTVTGNLAIATDIAGIDYSPELKVLAGVQTSQTTTTANHLLAVYDISGGTPSLVSSITFPPPNKATPNAVSGVDIRGGRIFAVDPDNGLLAATVSLVDTPTPPTFVAQPIATLNIVAGGYGSLSASATGSKPLSYQWRLNGENVADATNNTLFFTNVTAAAAGSYTLVVTNNAGELESSAAAVTVTPSILSDRASLLWSVNAGTRSWMTDANTERGIAYNSASNHVLVVSRTGNIDIHVLNADTGEHLWTMNTDPTIVAGSNPAGFRLNMIGVADDGAVYATSLDTGGSLYSIYKWEDDSPDAVPTLVWTGNPAPSAHRFGDTLDVRGAGADTQIIATSNPTDAAAQTVEPARVAIFRPGEDGMFTATIIEIPGVQGQAFRLGVAFGEGNTFWGKSTAQPLQRVSFDLEAGTGVVLNTYATFPNLSAPIAVQGASNLLAAISFETPDNLQLYDLSDLEAGPQLVDQDFFPTDNVNANGTGSIDIHGDRLFALNSNNGIIALKLKPASNNPPTAARLSGTTVSGGNVTFQLTGTPGAIYTIESTVDFSSWTTVRQITAGQDGTIQVTDTAGGAHKFYRAVAR